ncbi:MAG: 3D domain-containing protein [Phycisphaeraceae bacterium]
MTRWTTRLKSRRSRLALAGLCGGGFVVVLAWSGIEAFQRQAEPVALAATVSSTQRPSLGQRPAPAFEIGTPAVRFEEVAPVAPASPSVATARGVTRTSPAAIDRPTDPRYQLDRMGEIIMVDGKPWTGEVFDYRPIRPVRTQLMKTTAYSPDERSCGKWADGITASGKSVWMNGGRLVAADRKIPYGTILTVPGYNNEKPVQVWDRGGKIRGNRLDLLYPTHEIALQWGVQDLPVVFWEFVETD